MRKRSVFLVWALAVVCITALLLPGEIKTAQIYRGQVTAEMFALGVTGWAIALYGPITLAALFWSSRRARASVIANLLFIPGAIALLAAGDRLLFFANDGWPDTPLEFAITPAYLLQLLVLMGHLAGIVVTIIGKSRQAA